MARRKILIVTQEEPNGPMTFSIEGQGSTVINPKDLSEAIRNKLIDMGLRVKVSRAIAGKGSDPAAAWTAAKRLIDALKQGQWSTHSAAGSRKKAIKREAVLAALRRVPLSMRRQVAEQLIADGAPIKMEDVPGI